MGWTLCSLILAGVFSAFGYSAENPFGVRIIWLVCALSCLIGLLFFTPFKLGDTREETRKILGLQYRYGNPLKCQRILILCDLSCPFFLYDSQPQRF
jgi:hypothetical protein